ncbi:MAG: xanthine dehydrogenase family protein molybdopterin-binding subunit, partial [Acidimicrobiia bacterium]
MTSVIGASLRRTDGEMKVRGEAVYGVDYVEAGMLVGKLLRSPVPAGRIVSLDTSKAEAMPGVRSIATAADAPDTLGGWVLRDQPLFAVDRVRYEGEPVAAVAAETVDQAEAAVRAIELTIEETEAVADIEAALAPHAPLVHPDWERYVPTAGDDYPRGGNVVAEMISDP